MKLLFLETFDGEPYLEQSYNEVTENMHEHMTLRVFREFSDMLNYYDFVTTQNSGNYSINSFDDSNRKQFFQALAARTKLFYNGFLEVKRCTMGDNQFPQTEEILFVTNPSVN